MRAGRACVPPRIARAIRLILGFVVALLVPALTAAQPQPAFPALTGRVVDAANILKPDDRAALEQKLKAHEDKTTDQDVVATDPGLGGTSVEDYSNRIFPHLARGQKEKNNSVQLVVAHNDRKVRIYGG